MKKFKIDCDDFIEQLKLFLSENPDLTNKMAVYTQIIKDSSGKYSILKNLKPASFYRYFKHNNVHYDRDQQKWIFEPQPLDQSRLSRCVKYITDDIIDEIKPVFFPVMEKNTAGFIYELNRIHEIRYLIIKTIPCAYGVLVFFSNSPIAQAGLSPSDAVKKIIAEFNSAENRRQRMPKENSAFYKTR